MDNLGQMKLMLDDVRQIIENDPIFRIPRSRRPEILAKVAE
jgi:hypothetical protein